MNTPHPPSFNIFTFFRSVGCKSHSAWKLQVLVDRGASLPVGSHCFMCRIQEAPSEVIMFMYCGVLSSFDAGASATCSTSASSEILPRFTFLTVF